MAFVLAIAFASEREYIAKPRGYPGRATYAVAQFTAVQIYIQHRKIGGFLEALR